MWTCGESLYAVLKYLYDWIFYNIYSMPTNCNYKLKVINLIDKITLYLQNYFQQCYFEDCKSKKLFDDVSSYMLWKNLFHILHKSMKHDWQSKIHILTASDLHRGAACAFACRLESGPIWIATLWCWWLFPAPWCRFWASCRPGRRDADASWPSRWPQGQLEP